MLIDLAVHNKYYSSRIMSAYSIFRSSIHRKVAQKTVRSGGCSCAWQRTPCSCWHIKRLQTKALRAHEMQLMHHLPSPLDKTQQLSTSQLDPRHEARRALALVSAKELQLLPTPFEGGRQRCCCSARGETSLNMVGPHLLLLGAAATCRTHHGRNY